MKEIDFSKQILEYKEEGLLADEKAGYPPKCKPGYEVSGDKKKCVPIKKLTGTKLRPKRSGIRLIRKNLSVTLRRKRGNTKKTPLRTTKVKLKNSRRVSPSEKKSVEIHDLKKDEKYDKERKAGWKKKAKGAKMSSKQKK